MNLIERKLFKRYEGWPGSSQFEGTGKRWKKWIDEMCWDPNRIEQELKKCFKDFEEPYDEMLVSGPSSVWTLCPHHLLPCYFKVWIGYVPHGRVLGLSKFTRIATIMGKRPIMQEQYTRELADILQEKLGPQGIGVSVTGIHGCMATRGIIQEVPITTSVLKGCIMEEASAREEFYNIVRRQA